MKSLMENFTFCAVQFVLFNKKPELMIKKEKNYAGHKLASVSDFKTLKYASLPKFMECT